MMPPTATSTTSGVETRNTSSRVRDDIKRFYGEEGKCDVVMWDVSDVVMW